MARIFCADDIDRALERELSARERMNSPEQLRLAAARCNRRKAMLKMVERGREKAHAKWGKEDGTNEPVTRTKVRRSRKSD